MKKKIKQICMALLVVLAIIVFVFLIPIFINAILQYEAMPQWLLCNENTGSMLAVYSTMLASIATVYLGYIAYKQNKVANDTNTRLLELEKISKKAYVMLDKEESCTNDDMTMCTLIFNLLSSVPVTEYRITQKRILKRQRLTEKNENVILISGAECYTIIDESGFEVNLACAVENNYIKKSCYEFLFDVNLKSIYGYETIQEFHLSIINGNVVDCKTIEVHAEKTDDIDKILN